VVSVTALGTQSIGKKKMTETREVTVSPGDGYEVPPGWEDITRDGVRFENITKLDVSCTENIGIAKLDLYGETEYITFPKTRESGSCIYYEKVSKTYLEIYGLELVLPRSLTPVFRISVEGGDA
jgi:hypothetical protein